jgi:chromosome segregation ATPase
MELRASKRTSPAKPLSPQPSGKQSKQSTSKRDSGGQQSTRGRPGLVDATVYDFERLERAVASLAEQHEQAKRENARLRNEAELREARVGELEAKLKAAEDRRQAVLGRIDALMSELDRLDGLSVDSHGDSEGPRSPS